MGHSVFYLPNTSFSGTNHKPERRRPFGTGLLRHCPQGLFSPFFTFLHSIYIFPPFLTFPRPLYLPLGLRGCISPNWSQETMAFHSSNCFSILGSGKRTIGDFSSKQLLHDPVGRSGTCRNYSLSDKGLSQSCPPYSVV